MMLQNPGSRSTGTLVRLPHSLSEEAESPRAAGGDDSADGKSKKARAKEERQRCQLFDEWLAQYENDKSDKKQAFSTKFKFTSHRERASAARRNARRPRAAAPAAPARRRPGRRRQCRAAAAAAAA
eukprot:SAG22_NODE_7647_length_720_cov_4.077295_1_plen_125_part_01